MKKIIGMIGFGAIAKVHSRIIFQRKESVNILLVRSDKSVSDAKSFFFNNFSYIPKITKSKEYFFSSKINMLILCSPPETHLSFLKKAFDNKLNVFCEKPLFWDNRFSYKELKDKVTKIEKHKNINFIVNTSNSYFIEQILKSNKISKINFLKFIFHTNGPNEFSNIGIDLLPHGISILIKALGFGEITNLELDISKFFVKYKFLYRDALIEFEFMQGTSIEKKMIIQLNDKKFTRIQSGTGNSYEVSFVDEGGENVKNIKDPFPVYLDLFFNGFRQHKDYLFNFYLMCEILKGKQC